MSNDAASPSNPVGRTSAFNKVRAYRSLQQVLLVLVLFSIAFPALISGTILIRENFNQTIKHDTHTAATSYIDLLQAGLTLPLWNISPDLGKPLIEAISVDKSVLSIYVETPNHREFLSYKAKEANPKADSISLQRKIEYEGDTLGVVNLVYSLEEARNRAESQSRLLLTILSVQLVFSVALMSFFLRKRVTAPLHALESSAAGIAAGDLETQLPELGNDEFGVLSNQLERMRGVLYRAFHDLEERVKLRTADLEEVNSELQGTLDKLRHAQGELVQSEKLAALGSLVAGISHELNTPIGNGLTVASSLYESTTKIRGDMKDGGLKRSSLEGYLDDMDEGMSLVCVSLEKASELVSSFKQVAVDRATENRRRFMLSSLLKETRLTMATVMKHEPYTLDIKEHGDVALNSFPGPLGQVITNLLNNAVLHAFDGRGHGHIQITTVQQPGAVKIILDDDGKGISEANISRIFDPFFTTKLGEGGSGLGLHIVHNIVTAVLGGTIEVRSEIGVGTTFVLKIPLVAPVPEDGGGEANDNDDGDAN